MQCTMGSEAKCKKLGNFREFLFKSYRKMGEQDVLVAPQIILLGEQHP